MASRVRRDRREYQTYVDGNTVRKLNNTRPVRREKDVRETYAQMQTIQKNREKARFMDGPFVLALSIAMVVTLFLCVNYLRVQASITAHINRIEALELRLEHLKSENDALETRIDAYIDLDHVYQVATQELGMVYANASQILLYDKTESEYVRQYEDVPKH